MSKQKHKDVRITKRAQFEQKASSTKKFILIIVIALVVIAGVLFALRGQKQGFSAGIGPEIRIPLSELQGGDAKFYEYTTKGNQTVRFFVVRSKDGNYHSAADACRVCYEGKQGYHQEGEDMVCNKCGQRFASKEINHERVGCNPMGFPNRIEGNTLVVQTAQLEADAQYF